MNLADRVRQEIAAIFDRLAADESIGMDEDTQATAPFQLFIAEQALIDAWDKFIEEREP